MIKDVNPDHYKAEGANFIEYMDDPKIRGFGDWMFANGFNSGVWASTNWISVKDRLPKERTHVLVCVEYSVDYPDNGEFDVKKSLVKEGYWSRGIKGRGRGWYHCLQPDIAQWISGVTHWMPLPELPEVEG